MRYPRLHTAAIGLVLMTGLLASTGCNMSYGPRFGVFAYPIPVSPYLQHKLESDSWEQEHGYGKVPVLEPLVPGVAPIAMDPPSHDEVIRALERARPQERGIPFMYELQRNNVRIVTDVIQDQVDPVRVVPLVGPVQAHHVHYRCKVYFSEVARVGWPIPYTTTNEDACEIVYIDHDHLHMVGNPDVSGLGQ